jgi:hypothetical protein
MFDRTHSQEGNPEVMAYPPPGQYPAYPQYPGQSGMPAKPPTPQTVQNAFYLMLAGAGLTLIGAIIGLTEISKVRDTIATQNPTFTTTQVDNAVHAGVAIGAVVGLIEIGLWLWMAFANRSGKNWARITATVFFGISCLSVIGLLAASSGGSGMFSAEKASGIGVVIGIITWLVGLAAIILLWNKQSRPYFKPQQFGAPGYPYPYPYAMPGPQQPANPDQPGAQQPPYGAPQPGQPGDPWSNPSNPPQQ